MSAHSRNGLHNGNGNIPLSAIRQANSRASIAGLHLHQHGGKHYGYRSHSEADLLGG